MAINQASPSNNELNQAQSLPQEAVDFAHQQFERARKGDERLLLYIQAGLPANLARFSLLSITSEFCKTNDKGDSLIMLAAYHGHAALVRRLLEHGADSNRENDRGQTPLAGAVFKMHTEVVQALLDGRADPHLGNPSAYNAAHMFKQEQYITLFDAKFPQTEAQDNRQPER